METLHIAMAVPAFLLGIGLEYASSRRRGLCVYRLNDAITNLSCGMMSQLGALLYASAQIAIYAWVFEHGRLVRIDTPIAQWTLAFVGVDLLYYWWHRLSHTVNVLWAAHVVHHQSEEYNLAVALRQAVLTSWTGLPFYLPLAILGVPTAVYAAMLAASTLYQFWIHTRLVRPIRGPLGLVLNLPAHHRVHHAINARYLDKNFGATLIVWDRLFGTFVEETEPPRYGITRRLASFNPLWAQLHAWVELAGAVRAAPSWRTRLGLLFASPAALHPAASSERARGGADARYDPPIPRAATVYAVLSLVPLLAATVALMAWGEALAPAIRVGAVALVVAGLISVGALLEGRRWSWPLEAARLAASGVFLLAVLR